MRLKKINNPLISYQKVILDNIGNKDKKIIGFIAGTGAGKTFLLPFLVLKFFKNQKGKIIIISSPTVAMIKRTVLRYITDAFDRWEIDYTLNKVDLTMKIGNNIIYFISSTDPEKLQGIHADLIIGDEAGLYSRKWFDVAIQRLSFKKGQLVLTTTPYDPTHWLKTEIVDKAKIDPSILVISVPSWKNPFYPIEEYWKAKEKLPPHLFEMLYNAKFVDDASNKIFTKNLINNLLIVECQLYKPSGDYIITVDVARMGEDRTVVMHWIDNTLIKIETYVKKRIDEIYEILMKYKPKIFIIDETGLGSGLVDFIRKDGRHVIGVNFAQQKNINKRYLNKRAEIYFKMAEYIHQKQIKICSNINIDSLVKELQSIEYSIKNGKLAVVDKEKIKEKLGYSPDLADAFVLFGEYLKSGSIPILITG